MRLLLSATLAAGLALLLGAWIGGSSTRAVAPLVTSQQLSRGWALRSASEVSDSGEEISRVGYRNSGWRPVSVPSTVLAGLVANHVYDDVYFGLNLRSVPDLTTQRWWFRGEFQAPTAAADRRYWLRFGGISYRGRIWLNGKEIDPDAVGSLPVHEYDVSDAIARGRRNAIAVLVTPPRHGCADLSFCTVDWNPEAPDMGAGLWGETRLELSGPVALRDPYVRTVLPLPSTTSADLTVYVDAINATARPVRGTISGSIRKPGDRAVPLRRRIVLAAHERRQIVVARIRMRRPSLWWPYQLGAPELYRLDLSATVGGRRSDTRSIHFGIRQFTAYRKTVRGTSFVGFRVNGRRVFFRGGGYVWDLLQRWSTRTNAAHLRYVRGMGLNTIRLEGTLGNDELYRLADRLGIMVFAGFVCCSAWENEAGWTTEQRRVAESSLESQLRALRAHASAFLWAYGSDKPPLPAVLARYKRIARLLHWQNPTVDNVATWANERAGMKMDGPYRWEPPLLWWEARRPGSAFGTTAEEGTEAPPPLESMRRFIPADELWPIGNAWNVHTGKAPFDDVGVYSTALGRRYGEASGAADYARKAQLQNYETTRAFFEAWSAHRFRTSFGAIFWMLNNAWPSLHWSLYDYYLKPAGAYFGARKANEPLHVAYDYARRGVYVVNSTLRRRGRIRVSARVYTVPALTARYTATTTLPAPANRSRKAFTIPALRGLSATYFIRLQLRDRHGSLLSDNLYWYSSAPDRLQEQSNWYMTPAASYADLSGLNRLAANSRLSATASARGGTASIRLVNRSRRALAFFVRAELTAGRNGREVLPIEYSDNYVSLWPGESRRITARFQASDLRGRTPYLRVEGYNVPARSILVR